MLLPCLMQSTAITITIESYGNTEDILVYDMDDNTFIGASEANALPGYFIANLSQISLTSQVRMLKLCVFSLSSN
jgi:hypothetical protein